MQYVLQLYYITLITVGDFMRIIFKNCTLLDGTKDMVARENIDVAIENDKIVEIGKIEQRYKNIPSGIQSY